MLATIDAAAVRATQEGAKLWQAERLPPQRFTDDQAHPSLQELFYTMSMRKAGGTDGTCPSSSSSCSPSGTGTPPCGERRELDAATLAHSVTAKLSSKPEECAPAVAPHPGLQEAPALQALAQLGERECRLEIGSNGGLLPPLQPLTSQLRSGPFTMHPMADQSLAGLEFPSTSSVTSTELLGDLSASMSGRLSAGIAWPAAPAVQDASQPSMPAGCSLPGISFQMPSTASAGMGLSALQANPWIGASAVAQPSPAHLAAGGMPSPYLLSLPQALAAQGPPHLQALLLREQQQQLAALQFGRQHSYYGASHHRVLARRQAAANDPPEALVGLHGRYQPYCQQIITPRMNEAASLALAAIKLLQAGSTGSSASGKRYFCSLKEVSKVVHRARCLIVAPDVQVSSTASINPVHTLQRILTDAQLVGVPIIFALSRRGIGQVFGRDKSMSIVAITHLEGLEAEFGVMVEEAVRGRQLYMQHHGCVAPVPALAPMACCASMLPQQH